MAESATSVGSLTFFGLFAMSAFALFYASPARRARPTESAVPGHRPTCLFSGSRGITAPAPACPLHPQTSYWLGDANEMVAINTILIIVNGRPPGTPSPRRMPELFAGKGGELAACSSKRSVNHLHDWLSRRRRRESYA